MVVCAAFVFLFRIRDLIGGEVFTSLIVGRYHRPISEERVFLFLDLVGSTAYARDHGDLPAQEFLKAVFAAIAEPVWQYRGQVDDYIGDQVIISWPIERGPEQAQCTACTFAIFETGAEPLAVANAVQAVSRIAGGASRRPCGHRRGRGRPAQDRLFR